MGFIQIANVGDPSEISGIWNQYINTGDIEYTGRYKLLDVTVTDGTRFLVNKNQAIVLFAGEKFVDYCVGPGAYVYHNTFECGKYTKETALFSEILREDIDKFGSRIEAGDEVSCVLLNMSKFVRVPFTFDEAAYHDMSLDLDIVLCGSGYIEIGEADPLLTYVGTRYSKEGFLEFSLPELSEEAIKVLGDDFENAFEQTLIEMKEVDIDYNRIPYCSEKIIELANTALLPKWMAFGILVKSVSFFSIYPDERSVGEIVRVKRERKNAPPQTDYGAPASQPQAMQQPYGGQSVQTMQQPYGGQPQAMQQPYGGQPMQTPQQPMQDAEQEYVIRSGICNWVKTPLLIQNGNASLTNKRFVYKKGKINMALTTVVNRVMGGDKNFEFPLSELVAIEIGQQGIAKTVIFKLNGGITFVCVFKDVQEWLQDFRNLRICSVPNL